MTFALHPGIDREKLQKQFAASGRVRIPEFLEEAGARRLLASLLSDERWRHVVNGGAKVFEIARKDWATIDPDVIAKLDDAVVAGAQYGFQYRYDSIRVDDAADQRLRSNTVLDRFALFMESEDVLAALVEITGDPGISRIDAQATIYRPMDFLTAHDDHVAGKSRRAAYVLGLTEHWRVDWGGLLHYHDDVDRGAFVAPRFNTCDLFRVPMLHAVSQVTPSACHPRVSVTGWLRGQKERGGD